MNAKVLDGGYGAGVEAQAEWQKDHRGEKLRLLPPTLKADPQTLHSTPKSGKAAEAERIADSAIAGSSGAALDSFAKAMRVSPDWKGGPPSGS